MKRIVFLLFACSMAFAQAEDSGYDDVGAYEDVSGEEQSAQAPAPQEEPVVAPPPEESVEPAPEPPARVEPIAYDDTKVAEPVTSKDESWEEAWQKRRFNISFFVGFLPFTAIIEAFVHDKDKEPDATAYSVAIGWELFYLAELSLMANYTTVAGHALYTVTPRIKLNYLNFKYFRLYSYFGLGGIFWDGGSYLMFNFALLGAEIGGPISVFFEHGWGQVGMLTCGVKLAF